MQLEVDSFINGTFHGWNGDNYYELGNGQVWQQAHYKYGYKYAYRPRAKVYREGFRYFLEVEGMDDMIEVKRVSGTLYIYDSQGNAVGFWRGRYVYDINGRPIGQLNGSHVHKLSGAYVGELHKDMVVDKHLGNLGNIGNPGNPGNPGHPGYPGNRGTVSIGFPDVFYKLLEE